MSTSSTARRDDAPTLPVDFDAGKTLRRLDQVAFFAGACCAYSKHPEEK